MNDDFYTGDQVQIDPDLVSDQVITLLDDYDEKTARGEKPDINPMKEKIIIRTNDGKAFEIPEDIQRAAIEKWLAIKNEKEMGGLRYRVRKEGKYNEINNNDNNDDDDEGNKDSSITQWTKYLLCFIIFAILVYFLVYKTKYFKNF